MQITSDRAMKRIGYGCLFVIAIWVVFVIWLYTGFPRGQQELSSSSLVEYQKSEIASWIALPDNAREITTYKHLGFDTNYRYLKATLSDPIPALPDLIAQSISLQPFKPNETYMLVENGRVEEGLFVPPPSSHRTCGFPASGGPEVSRLSGTRRINVVFQFL